MAYFCEKRNDYYRFKEIIVLYICISLNIKVGAVVNKCAKLVIQRCLALR